MFRNRSAQVGLLGSTSVDALVGVAAVGLTHTALVITVAGTAAMHGHDSVARVLPAYVLAVVIGLVTLGEFGRRCEEAVPGWVAWLNVVAMAPIGLAVAAFSGLAVEAPCVDSFRWFQFAAIAVSIVVAGPRAGVAAVGVALAVDLGMVAVTARPPDDVTVYAIDRLVDLVVVAIAVQVLRLAARAHAAAARAEGRLAEEQRMLRIMHDTALQALEAIALGASTAGSDDVLAGIRRQARQEAGTLRRLLRAAPTTVPAPRSTGSAAGTACGAGHDLGALLEDLVADFAARDLGVELVGGPPDGVQLRPGHVAALVGAAREALTNVVKHAGTDAAVLRISLEGSDVTVTVRDQGVGFEPGRRTSGFGLTNSIAGRLVDAGGSAEIWSVPGRGTRVVLRVPVLADAAA